MGHSESKTAAVDVSTGPIEYSVTVHTGEKRHSGTDASVYVQLYGDKVKNYSYFGYSPGQRAFQLNINCITRARKILKKAMLILTSLYVPR